MALVLVAGCGPTLTVDNAIGVVKSTLFDDAERVLEREGIHVQAGDHVVGVIGIRVPTEDAFRATKILLEWRRDKGPGAFLTREEFVGQLQD
jgi:hypothetical protein